MSPLPPPSLRLPLAIGIDGKCPDIQSKEYQIFKFYLDHESVVLSGCAVAAHHVLARASHCDQLVVGSNCIQRMLMCAQFPLFQRLYHHRLLLEVRRMQFKVAVAVQIRKYALHCFEVHKYDNHD